MYVNLADICKETRTQERVVDPGSLPRQVIGSNDTDIAINIVLQEEGVQAHGHSGCR